MGEENARVVYLIEQHYGRRWLRLRTSTCGMETKAVLEWCDDARAALQFARREDAEACMVMWQSETVLARATEHVFLPNADIQRAPSGDRLDCEVGLVETARMR